MASICPSCRGIPGWPPRSRVDLFTARVMRADWNNRLLGNLMNRYRFAAWFAVAFSLTFALNLRQLRSKDWTLPDQDHDCASYLNLAESLATGKGFAYDWDNPAWRSAYERAKDSGAWPENDSTFDNNVRVDF